MLLAWGGNLRLCPSLGTFWNLISRCPAHGWQTRTSSNLGQNGFCEKGSELIVGNIRPGWFTPWWGSRLKNDPHCPQTVFPQLLHECLPLPTGTKTNILSLTLQILHLPACHKNGDDDWRWGIAREMCRTKTLAPFSLSSVASPTARIGFSRVNAGMRTTITAKINTPCGPAAAYSIVCSSHLARWAVCVEDWA